MTDAIAWQATTRPISPAALIAVTITVLSTRQATATPASITAVPWSLEVSNHRANGPEANAIATIDTTAKREARRHVLALAQTLGYAVHDAGAGLAVLVELRAA